MKLVDLNIFNEGMSEDQKNDFLAKFGLGPKYVPPKPNYKMCDSCGYDKAVVQERHADSAMNCMVIACPKCGHDKEL